MNERYRNGVYNPSTFKELWGQYPNKVCILRDPECISRPSPFSHRVDLTDAEPELEPNLAETLQGLEAA